MARLRAGLAALAACLAIGAATAQKPAANESELRELRSRIEKMQRELEAAEESRGEAAGELRATEKAASEAHRALFDLGREARAIEARIDALGVRSREVRQGIAQQQALAARMLRLQHFQGAPDRLRLILEGRDAAELARHLHYFGYIQRHRTVAIRELQRGAQELAALESEAQARRAELAVNQQAQAQQARALENERAARAALVKRLAGTVEKGRREIGRLKRDEARLAKLVEELARSLAARPVQRPSPRGRTIDQVADASLASKAFETLKGRLKLPVRGELANTYGSPREEGGATWKGLFIRAGSGETVRAVADGQVVYSDWLRGFGNLLILDHGRKYMSLYAYNEGLLRQVGDKVSSGDAIAQVGATGGTAQSGLYFELRHDGVPFDPLRWVAR